MKKFFVIFFLSIFFSITLINTAFAEIMLFVGDGCPHCENVEKYMDENNVLGRLPVKVYEVWNHPENQPLYIQKAKEVGYTGQGVPLLIDGPHYETGDYPIIAYFAGLLENQTSKTTSKLEEDAIPVVPENSMTKDDSRELNEILEEKINDGEQSELKDPSQLYDAANALEVEGKTTSKNPTLFYTIIGFAIAGVLVILYFVKKGASKKKSKRK